MNCPKCNYPETKVMDSLSDTKHITRRRKCKKCGKLFFTIESISSPSLFSELNSIRQAKAREKRGY